METIRVSYSDCRKAGPNGKDIFEKKTKDRSITVEAAFGYPFEGKPYVTICYSPTGHINKMQVYSLNPEKTDSWKSPCGSFLVLYVAE